MFPYQLAEYLYREGVCGNPLEDVSASGGFPAPFAYLFQDSPNRAMCVTAVTVTNTVSDSNPEVHFTLMFRGGFVGVVCECVGVSWGLGYSTSF